MKTNTVLFGGAALAVLIGASTGAYFFGMNRGWNMASAPAAATAAPADPSAWTIPQGEAATKRHIKDGLKAGDVDPATGREVLYYHDPMVPGKRFDAPAKSPFMDMMLVPVYGGGGGGADTGTVTVSPRVQQNLGLATAVVVEGAIAPKVTAVGNIAWNERDQAVVAARAAGVVEKLYARAQFDRIALGAPVADLFVPDWVAAQEEFLSLRRSPLSSDMAPLIDAARQRMRLAGMVEEQIAQVEQSGRVQVRTTVRAPIGGLITEVMVREGAAVAAGAALVRIANLSTVWAQAEVPESQAALLKPGTPVRATTPALAGLTFTGRVQSLLPDVNPATRTIKARVELANAGQRLVPGMTVSMSFADLQADKALLVPSDAVIRTGTRSVVMLAEGDGRFRPVEVETGIESGGQTAIHKGLSAGQRVVVSSQFLIDSEASLKGVESRLNRASDAAASAVSKP